MPTKLATHRGISLSRVLSGHEKPALIPLSSFANGGLSIDRHAGTSEGKGADMPLDAGGDIPVFRVLVIGTGIDAGRLAALAPESIEVSTDVTDPDCVVLGHPDGEGVRRAAAAYPRALLLVVAPMVPAAGVFAAGAAACIDGADPRLVAAQVRALWRRRGARQVEPGHGSAAGRWGPGRTLSRASATARTTIARPDRGAARRTGQYT
jgi:hypothetical protein